GQALLWLFEQFWRMGSARDRKGKASRTARLPVPVVSIGNITTGGTGKTPAVIELLCAFRSSKPGLLTRGHGRSLRERVLFLEEDQNITPAISGDEAQLCMREARVPIGIGANRYSVGLELVDKADVRVLFLDDG